jgi:hypothetical protein
MFVGRLIAATDVTTGAANAQMQPGIARFQALFTSASAGNDIADSRDVFAMWGHASAHPVLSGVFELNAVAAWRFKEMQAPVRGILAA